MAWEGKTMEVDMMVVSLIVGLIGVIFLILGYMVWKKEKISLFHDYHYDKVSEEDKTAFCTISGIGVVLIGAGVLLAAVLIALTNSVWSCIPIAIGFVAGLILLVYAGMKFNR